MVNFMLSVIPESGKQDEETVMELVDGLRITTRPERETLTRSVTVELPADVAILVDEVGEHFGITEGRHRTIELAMRVFRDSLCER